MSDKQTHCLVCKDGWAKAICPACNPVAHRHFKELLSVQEAEASATIAMGDGLHRPRSGAISHPHNVPDA